MNLFEQAHQDRLEKEGPLAARMRPRTLDEYVGQAHIIGPGRLLRRAIQADQLGSLIFYGPPGTGKTTLAQVIANSTSSHFIKLNAVLSGVKDIREAVAEAQNRAAMHGQRTTLFVDEVHRFNKAQQDALLPWVENGTVIFIGATTENPYFEVNKALVSRSRIFQLLPLQPDDIRAVIMQTLADSGRGYGTRTVQIDDDALAHLVNVANGDARAALNALELAVETTEPSADGSTGDSASDSADNPLIQITLAIAEESIQQRAVLYDKEGDYHYDTISAFIKSLRGSDPDAALYWMAKMIHAGESPRFVFRRMMIFASEDVGLADPQAVGVVKACADSFEFVGMPEGRFPLAQAAIYLATAPKSNSTFAFFDALASVEAETDSGVPNHLRDGTRDKEGFGHGEGYLYPHAFRDHWVAQQYLPLSLQGKVFYQPSDQGYEDKIRLTVARQREAQLAAMIEAEAAGEVIGLGVEILTYSPDDPARDRWLQRTVSTAGDQLGALRDRLLDDANLGRHHLVLDLKAGSGLLMWEALRRVPEGGVYAIVHNQRDAEALGQMAAQLDELMRPILIEDELAMGLAQLQEDEVRFDAIIGNGVLAGLDKKERYVAEMAALLGEGGAICLAERIPRYTQRLYELVDLATLSKGIQKKIREAEEAIYANEKDPLVNWDKADLIGLFEGYKFAVDHSVKSEQRPILVTEAAITRWFTPTNADSTKVSLGPKRSSYAEHLLVFLSKQELDEVEKLFRKELLNKTVDWCSKTLFLRAKRARSKKL